MFPQLVDAAGRLGVTGRNWNIRLGVIRETEPGGVITLQNDGSWRGVSRSGAVRAARRARRSAADRLDRAGRPPRRLLGRLRPASHGRAAAESAASASAAVTRGWMPISTPAWATPVLGTGERGSRDRAPGPYQLVVDPVQGSVSCAFDRSPARPEDEPRQAQSAAVTSWLATRRPSGRMPGIEVSA
jgi:hypothetical protein